MLNRREAKIDPGGTPFLRRRNLLCLLSSVERVKLGFRTSSMIILTMCLSGRSLKQLAGKAMVPDSVISSCQIDKYGTGFLFSLERILDVLG